MLAFSLPSRDKNQLLLILRCKFTKSAENSVTLPINLIVFSENGLEEML